MAQVVTTLEDGLRDFQGGGMIGIRQQWRDILRGDLVLEPIDEVFLREIIGGPRLIAQQISANRYSQPSGTNAIPFPLLFRL